MHVIAKKTLVEFWKKHSASKGQLEAWYGEASKTIWKTSLDIKKKYSSADFLNGNRVVFDICGNKFRLIVKIAYKSKTVFIRFVGTHAEYSKIDAEKV